MNIKAALGLADGKHGTVFLNLFVLRAAPVREVPVNQQKKQVWDFTVKDSEVGICAGEP